MNNKLKILFLIIGLVFFGFLINDFGIKNIITNLKITGWYFVPIIGTWLVVYLLNAKAWRFIINKPELSFFEVLSVTISGYALNYITPFFNLGGEPYRVLALKDRLGLTRSVSVTISYVMLHFLSSFLIWITAVIVIFILVPLSPAVYIGLGVSLVVFGVIVALFVQGYKKGITKSFMSLIIKLPLPKKLEENFKSRDDLLAEIDENIKELFNNRRKSFFAANFYEYLSRVVATVEFYFILRAIGLTPTLLDTFIINAGAGLISNMLFFVPFELGVKEGGLFALLGFLKYVPSTGVYVGIVDRLREMFWILVGLILISISNFKTKNNKGKSLIYDESSFV